MIRQDERFYEELLKNLIAHGLIKLFEREVVIRCLHLDIRHAKNVTDVDEDKGLDERSLLDNSLKGVQDYSLQESASDQFDIPIASRLFLKQRMIRNIFMEY
ncbi:unnamed protein product [Paramecium octaurelia]|uniref:Uncharacterized protein n=1 Tax=Paramecium octaurelia TaxID=43137 RepID=A0A8S1VRS0_PAROT|nr:unnamed protein product [Paramecium octaurelia]